jgi:hypothetical protein
MLCPDNHSGTIEHIAVSLNLLVESAKGVFVALNLVPDEVAIDDGNVSPASAVFQPQFVHDKGVLGGMVLAQSFAMKAFPDLRVIHGRL